LLAALFDLPIFPPVHERRTKTTDIYMEANCTEPIFILPEYESAQLRFFSDAVRKTMAAQDELYASIPTAEPAEVLPVRRNTMPDGNVAQNQRANSHLRAPFKDA
jgi:hypothetical protein